MHLINCKIHLELDWTKTCVMHGSNAYLTADNNNYETTFKINNKFQ